MREGDPRQPEKGPTEPDREGEEARLRARLEALKADLSGRKAEEKAQGAARGRTARDGGAIGKGLRAGSELLAGVIVGCGIGWLLDRQFDAAPLFLIIFMMFGMAAGFWNVYRLAARTGKDAGGSE